MISPPSPRTPIRGALPQVDPARSGAKLPSLVHALGALSELIPDDIAFTFLVDGESEEQNITFRQLDERARSIAARLQALGKQGDRVALVYEPGLEYIAALVGCFYAGFVAVPIYPPDAMRLQRTITRLHAVMDDAQASFILTGAEEFERFGGSIKGGAQVLVTDEIDATGASHWRQPEITGKTLAFLQYTSGSTGRPKGVMLSHANLMFNFEHIKRFDEPGAIAVSWLPMYHDMGLIGLVLQVLQSGRRTVLMSPLSFIKRPARWLQAISNYRAYATSGPSFAYDLCVQKVTDAERDQLDLSCWTLACNGAEPVRPDTLERFTQRFAPVGFRPEAFYPCYGLAEATLIVSGGKKEAAPITRTFDADALTTNRVLRRDPGDGSREIVGCGVSVENQRIAIVDPTTRRRCRNHQVGEVWVRGPGVAHGYWNNPTATEETFLACIEPTSELDTIEGPYLRTGDLGFINQGELFITGRIKDLIIVRGRNHYPQDIERTVEGCSPHLRRDNGAAFSVDINGEERLVIVQSVQRPKRLDLDQVMAGIRAAIIHEHETAPYAIMLVKGGEIPKTSSGKLQRRATKELYQNGELAIAAQWCEEEQQAAAPEPTACQVNGHSGIAPISSQILQDVSGIIRELKNGSTPAVIDERSLFFADLSIESIDLIMLNEQVEQRYQRQFPFFDFMAELGRQNQRDVSMGQFVEFISTNLTDTEILS